MGRHAINDGLTPNQRHLAKRAAEGKCVRCAQPREDLQFKRCLACREKAKEESKGRRRSGKVSKESRIRHYEKCKANRRCPRCGSETFARVFCAGCRRKLAAKATKNGAAPAFEKTLRRALGQVLFERPELRRDPEALQWVKDHLELYQDRMDTAMHHSVSLSEFEEEDQLSWMGTEDAHNE